MDNTSDDSFTTGSQVDQVTNTILHLEHNNLDVTQLLQWKKKKKK